MNVIWTQRNDGTADVGAGLWTDEIYLSEDDDFDPNVDTFLGSTPFFGPLGPDNRETSTFRSRFLSESRGIIGSSSSLIRRTRSLKGSLKTTM